MRVIGPVYFRANEDDEVSAERLECGSRHGFYCLTIGDIRLHFDSMDQLLSFRDRLNSAVETASQCDEAPIAAAGGR